MLGLAVISVRHRALSFLATFLNVFLGAAVLLAFASLLDTGNGAGVSAADRSTLQTIALVTGGWGVLIVAFGVASTLNLTVGQRGTELALLKAAGATPAQVGRLIVGEAAVVSVLGAVLATPLGYALGRFLVGALVDQQQVATGVQPRFGLAAVTIGFTDVVLAALLAALFSARRAARAGVRTALTEATAQPPRLSKKRIVPGLVFLAIGLECAVLSATALSDDQTLSLAIAGESCIWSAIGFAFLAPALMRFGERIFGPLVRPFTGVSGYLADLNVRQRSSESAGILIPAVLFIGMAGGTLALQQILEHAIALGGHPQTADEKGFTTINEIIVGMLATFAAVVLVNLAVATTVRRRREFGLQRVIGSTRAQVLRMVFAETFVTAATALVFGVLAAAPATIAYSLARSGTALVHLDPMTILAVLALTVVLLFLSNLAAARRALATSALDAVHPRAA